MASLWFPSAFQLLSMVGAGYVPNALPLSIEPCPHSKKKLKHQGKQLKKKWKTQGTMLRLSNSLEHRGEISPPQPVKELTPSTESAWEQEAAMPPHSRSTVGRTALPMLSLEPCPPFKDKLKHKGKQLKKKRKTQGTMLRLSNSLEHRGESAHHNQ